MAFLLLLALYTIVAAKVTQWMALTILGQRLLTPQLYLTHAWLYQAIRFVVLIVAIVDAVVSQNIPWYYSVVLVLIAWVASIMLGRRWAFEAIRKSSKQYLHYEDGLRVADPRAFREMTEESDYAASRAHAEKFANISNRELSDMLKLFGRIGDM